MWLVILRLFFVGVGKFVSVDLSFSKMVEIDPPTDCLYGRNNSLEDLLTVKCLNHFWNPQENVAYQNVIITTTTATPCGPMYSTDQGTRLFHEFHFIEQKDNFAS